MTWLLQTTKEQALLKNTEQSKQIEKNAQTLTFNLSPLQFLKETQPS